MVSTHRFILQAGVMDSSRSGTCRAGDIGQVLKHTCVPNKCHHLQRQRRVAQRNKETSGQDP
jgi:hypothetical protein